MKTLLITLFLTLSASAQLSLPMTQADENSKVCIPVSMTGADDVLAFQGAISFDPDVLTTTGIYNHGCSIGDDLFGFAMYCNEPVPGTLLFAAYSPYSFTGDATAFNVRFFTAKGETPLAFENVLVFNQYGQIDMDAGDGWAGLH